MSCIQFESRFIQNGELSMSRSEIVQKKMQEGFNCAQAVVSAFAPEMGLDNNTALKLSGAFGGGLAHQGHLCGAVSGAFVVLGMHLIIPTSGLASREQGYAVGERFIKAFKARNQSIECRQLIDCDLSTPDGLRWFQNAGIFQMVCPGWVIDAVEILEELLQLPPILEASSKDR